MRMKMQNGWKNFIFNYNWSITHFMKKLSRWWILVLSLVLFIGYYGGRYMVSELKEIPWYDIIFSLKNKDNEYKIRLWHNYNNDKDYLFLPAFFSDTEESISISIPAGNKKIWDRETKLSGGYELCDLSEGLHSLKIGRKEYAVNVIISRNLPAIFIETKSGSLNFVEAEKGNGESGLYIYTDKEGNILYEGKLSKLKSRGNVTFLEDKKPYQMNLEEGADLVGAGPQDKYILLANRQDPALIRNKLIFDMADDVGLDNSPKSEFIDLYINNDYRGIYQVTTKIDTGKNAIDINTSTDSRETDYLVTLEYNIDDRIVDEKFAFTTELGQNVIIKRPQNPTEEQFEYIKEDFGHLQKQIKSGSLKDIEIDMDSFSLKYVIEEFSKNLDAMHASQYFYKKGDRYYAGPVWDYDKSLGNPLIETTRPVDFQEPKGIYAATSQNGSSWWRDLYDIDDFKSNTENNFKEKFLPSIELTLDKRIDEITNEIKGSAYMDYIRWDTLEDQKYQRERTFEEGYGEEINNIRDFIKKRSAFLSDIWVEKRIYNMIPCDPGEGELYVKYVDAVYGRKLSAPSEPDWEGHSFSYWTKNGEDEPYDFDTLYDGEPFILKAVYDR